MGETSAGIIVVGDELISGETPEENLEYIARELVSLGIEPVIHLVVGDNVEDISAAIEFASSMCQIVIMTGGLGPTIDDLTRDAVAKTRKAELIFHPEIGIALESFFKKLGRDIAEANLRQANIPRGAKIIAATQGTAPGFMFADEEPFLYVLPGVPFEMKGMIDDAVIPDLIKKLDLKTISSTRALLVFGAGEADVAQALKERTENGNFQYAFLVRSGIISVKITARNDDPAVRRELLEAEVKEARDRLGTLVFGEEEQTLEEVVGKLLREKSKSIAIAESCTAGMIASRIANIPGASDYLKGSVVTYTREAKRTLLGISEDALGEGAVNESVARKMAIRVRVTLNADIGVGITGLAGPSQGGEKKPVGTVCLGLATSDGATSFEVRLPGNRNFIRSLATNGALNMVRLYLMDEVQTG